MSCFYTLPPSLPSFTWHGCPVVWGHGTPQVWGHATHVAPKATKRFGVKRWEEVHHRSSLLLWLSRQFSVPCLDPILLHRHRTRYLKFGLVNLRTGRKKAQKEKDKQNRRFDKATDIVKFVVEATCVTDRFPVLVPSPECGGCGLAISTAGALSPGWRLEEGWWWWWWWKLWIRRTREDGSERIKYACWACG